MTGDESEADWPVSLRGVSETVVTTRGPNERWNLAALGVHAPDDGSDHATARTWGRTRTRRNFEHEGEGYVHFLTDPVVFVDAACSIREQDDPVVEDAHAWVRVTVEATDEGADGGTEWVEWRLEPVESTVLDATVPVVNRGFNAVVEATVAASRLDVPSYDTETLVGRLAHYADVVAAAGGPREREAFQRLTGHTGWRKYTDEDG